MTNTPTTDIRVGAPLSVNNLFANCDAWGAAEWFDRLAMAIRAQDKAVVDRDDVRFETYRNIASSSAMRLVRDYESEVRAALASRPTRNAGVEVKALEWHGPDVNGDIYAKSLLGTYTVRAQQGSLGFWLTQVGGYHSTVEAAKAAAQADFDQRIRSALTSPAQETVTDAWRTMDSAPKDGSMILLYNIHHREQAVMGWSVGFDDENFPDGCWTNAGGKNQAISNIANGGYFQFWQPLPSTAALSSKGA